MAILAVFAVSVAPASASSRYLSKTTGLAADAYWTQIDGTPTGSTFGNVHIGSLYVYETSKGLGDAFAYISDFDCEEGQTPVFGHGEFGEPGDDACVYLGDRFGHGFGLAFNVDKKLSGATLVGNLTMVQGGGHGEDGTIVGNPRVDMIWNGQGNTSTNSQTYRYNDGTNSFTDRYKSTYRSAWLDGILGPMSFDPDLSGGSISSFSSFSKGRTK